MFSQPGTEPKAPRCEISGSDNRPGQPVCPAKNTMPRCRKSIGGREITGLAKRLMRPRSHRHSSQSILVRNRLSVHPRPCIVCQAPIGRVWRLELADGGRHVIAASGRVRAWACAFGPAPKARRAVFVGVWKAGSSARGASCEVVGACSRMCQSNWEPVIKAFQLDCLLTRHKAWWQAVAASGRRRSGAMLSQPAWCALGPDAQALAWPDCGRARWLPRPLSAGPLFGWARCCCRLGDCPRLVLPLDSGLGAG